MLINYCHNNRICGVGNELSVPKTTVCNIINYYGEIRSILQEI